MYKGISAEYPTSSAAVTATDKRVLTYKGSYAWTEFTSSNGGWIAAGDVTYQKAKADPYDPESTWTKVLTSSTIQKAYPSIGTFKSIQVTERDGDGNWGGRVERLKITGSTGSVSVSGSSFKAKFSLKERYFTIASGAQS